MRATCTATAMHAIVQRLILLGHARGLLDRCKHVHLLSQRHLRVSGNPDLTSSSWVAAYRFTAFRKA